jgi:hypothetical protein
MDQAFREAGEGRPVVLSFADLDYRDMRVDIGYVRDLIRNSARRFPDVSFWYCEARDAMRRALRLPAQDPCRITLEREGDLLSIRSDSPTFGPQPFFAVKTRSGEFYTDNLDIQQPFREWTYTFDEQTFPPRALEAAGIGTCDPTGNVTTAVMDMESSVVTTTYR